MNLFIDAYFSMQTCRWFNAGFGDIVTMTPELASIPSFLGLPEPQIRVYPVYTVIAEKFQAMVELDLANSRIKDFYDIWIIANRMKLEGLILQEAVKATFEQRQTQFADLFLTSFSDKFKRDSHKEKQWSASDWQWK